MKEFTMSEEELQAIYDISRNQTPVIYVGVWLGMDSQEKANKLWKLMADRHGFVWDSVKPSGKGDRIFLAEPREVESIDTTKVSNVVVEDVDHKDYPDFCDAFIASADYDGMEMTEAQLDKLNEEYGDFVHEQVLESLH